MKIIFINALLIFLTLSEPSLGSIVLTSPLSLKKTFLCKTQDEKIKIKISVDPSKLRFLRILTGADHFDSRLQNNAVELLLSFSPSKNVFIPFDQGFSYYDLDESSVVAGSVNEKYLDEIRVELIYSFSEINSHQLMGRIFISPEVHQQPEIYQPFSCFLVEDK